MDNRLDCNTRDVLLAAPPEDVASKWWAPVKRTRCPSPKNIGDAGKLTRRDTIQPQIIDKDSDCKGGDCDLPCSRFEIS